MMQVNNGNMTEERKEVERGMDVRTDSAAPVQSDRSNHPPQGGAARIDSSNAADDIQRLFSPRSTAAMALSSISQTFSMGSESAYDSKSNESSNGSYLSQEAAERLPFLPPVSTTKMSAPPPPNHSYRSVTDPSPSSARKPYYPHQQLPPPYPSSSPAMQQYGASELYHKSDKRHAPPYSTPDVNMHLERSFAASSDPMILARSHVKPRNYSSHPQPQFTPSLPRSNDANRRFPNHFPTNDPYQPRVVSWSNGDPSMGQWMPYPHHPHQHPPHPSLMLYPCYPMQQPTNVPHGNFGVSMAPTVARLPPTPIQSYVTPTPHKKIKVVGDAPPSLPYNVVPQVLPPATYSEAKAPSPPSRTEVVEVKVVEEKYNRKNKSLGVLAETFLHHFANSTVGYEIVIDRLSAELAVERRRIYDVVNILESLQVVVKMGKNTYHWMGREHLVRQFALLQQDGIQIWPERAAKAGLFPSANAPKKSTIAEESEEGKTAVAVVEIGNINKSLTRLSQMFLQVFLTGTDPVSLPEASDLIHGRGCSPAELVALGMKPGEEYPTDAKTFHQIATRGLKTKIRRLYDIANVFLSIGLISKSEYRRTACPNGKRPQFHFQYHLSLEAIRKAYDELPESMIENQSPFSERQLRILQVCSSNKETINFFSQPPTETELSASEDPLFSQENASPLSDSHFESFSQHSRNSTNESAAADVNFGSAESPNNMASAKSAEADEGRLVTGSIQSTPFTSNDETRSAKNIQVTPMDEANRSSPDQQEDETCFEALHVLGARSNDSSPRRVSLSAAI